MAIFPTAARQWESTTTPSHTAIPIKTIAVNNYSSIFIFHVPSSQDAVEVFLRIILQGCLQHLQNEQGDILKNKFLYGCYRTVSFPYRNPARTSFVIVLVTMVVLDIVFNKFHEPFLQKTENIFQIDMENLQSDNLLSAPETWLSLLSLILGTLVIVISIASQRTPKLIDFYLQEWISLYYIWFIVMAACHPAISSTFGDLQYRPSSEILNFYVFLPVSILLALPYIFYILRYTKTDQVINTIFRKNIRQIKLLRRRIMVPLMDNASSVEEAQFFFLESLNEMDEMLQYVELKETRADIIKKISVSIQLYVSIKPKLNPNFFKITHVIRNDISFRTFTDSQFEEMSEKRTFYEEKCFRILGNAFTRLMDKGEFELASLCASELTNVGREAVEDNDERLVEALLIRFNTFMRFAIKHALTNNERRHLFNLAFHYANFLKCLVVSGNHELLKTAFGYWRSYGNEILKYGETNPVLYFVVSGLSAELKDIMIYIYHENWDFKEQEKLLAQYLTLDNPPDYDRRNIPNTEFVKSGVRIIEIALALFYLNARENELVLKIIDNLLDDLDVVDEKTFCKIFDSSIALLESSTPTFWEDTDRGNVNIYYSPYKAMTKSFQALLSEKMKERLSETSTPELSNSSDQMLTNDKQ